MGYARKKLKILACVSIRVAGCDPTGSSTPFSPSLSPRGPPAGAGRILPLEINSTIFCFTQGIASTEIAHWPKHNQLGRFRPRLCKKSSKNANDLTDENCSRFFYFRSTSDLENKPRPAACENSAEFLHSLVWGYPCQALLHLIVLLWSRRVLIDPRGARCRARLSRRNLVFGWVHVGPGP